MKTTETYWLIWCKSVADQMPKNKGQTNQTYYAQAYRHACHDIAMALAEKIDELESEVAARRQSSNRLHP